MISITILLNTACSCQVSIGGETAAIAGLHASEPLRCCAAPIVYTGSVDFGAKPPGERVEGGRQETAFEEEEEEEEDVPWVKRPSQSVEEQAVLCVLDNP